MLEKIFSRIKGGIGAKKQAGKVMIIEDDALLAKVLSQGFLAEKMAVATVANGLEALEAVRKFAPRCHLAGSDNSRN